MVEKHHLLKEDHVPWFGWLVSYMVACLIGWLAA
jgi:hypothetical protein